MRREGLGITYRYSSLHLPFLYMGHEPEETTLWTMTGKRRVEDLDDETFLQVMGRKRGEEEQQKKEEGEKKEEIEMIRAIYNDVKLLRSDLSYLQEEIRWQSACLMGLVLGVIVILTYP